MEEIYMLIMPLRLLHLKQFTSQYKISTHERMSSMCLGRHDEGEIEKSDHSMAGSLLSTLTY